MQVRSSGALSEEKFPKICINIWVKYQPHSNQWQYIFPPHPFFFFFQCRQLFRCEFLDVYIDLMQVSNSFHSVGLSEYLMNNATQVDDWMLQWGLLSVSSSVQIYACLATLAAAALHDVRGRPAEKLTLFKKKEANF